MDSRGSSKKKLVSASFNATNLTVATLPSRTSLSPLFIQDVVVYVRGRAGICLPTCPRAYFIPVHSYGSQVSPALENLPPLPSDRRERFQSPPRRETKRVSMLSGVLVLPITLMMVLISAVENWRSNGAFVYGVYS